MIWFVATVLLIGLGYWLFMSPYSQFFGNFPYQAKTSKKVIAITFDDGPNEPYTSEIVDFLNSKNVKATFFQVGSCINRYPEATLKIFNSGHTIGIHSLSHKFSKYFAQPKFKSEITKTQAIIDKIIHVRPILFRPPWLFRQPLIFGQLKKLNIQPISGVFGSNVEVFKPNANTIAKHALAKAKPGLILIFHDGYNASGTNRSHTVQAVKIVVEDLLSQGYRFVSVDELLGIDAYAPRKTS